MSSRRRDVPSAILLVLLGTWLLLQTLVGDLPGRLLSWRNYRAPGPITPGLDKGLRAGEQIIAGLTNPKPGEHQAARGLMPVEP